RAGVVLRNDISLTPGAYDPTRLGDHDPAGPSLSGERRRDDPPTRRRSFPRQRPRVGPWPGRQRRGNGSSPHWNVKAGPALSGPFALGEKTNTRACRQGLSQVASLWAAK